jgi:hypothetical protein
MAPLAQAEIAPYDDVTEQTGLAVDRGARVDQNYREKLGTTSLAKRSTISGS